MKKKHYTLQNTPMVIPTQDGKLIKEHFGLASDGNSQISIAHMVAPAGWSEPFQTPEFDEYTFVIKGKKQLIVEGDMIVLEAGQSIKVHKGARVQYSNPFVVACEYLSICLPAFNLEGVNREKA